MKEDLPTGLRLLGVTEEDYEVLKRVIARVGSFEEFDSEVQQLRVRLEETLFKIDVMSEMQCILHPREYAEAAQVAARKRMEGR